MSLVADKPLAEVVELAGGETQPSVGRIVHYVLSKLDCFKIRHRRLGMRDQGNAVYAGMHCAAIVTRNWSPGMANLQVFLDGHDTLWVTSRMEGACEGTWHWPER